MTCDKFKVSAWDACCGAGDSRRGRFLLEALSEGEGRTFPFGARGFAVDERAAFRGDVRVRAGDGECASSACKARLRGTIFAGVLS